MRKEQPGLVIVGLLAAPLVVAAACGDGCSLDGQISIDHLFIALMAILACTVMLKIYILVQTIQDNNDRAKRRDSQS